jgi:hypothetical protein
MKQYGLEELHLKVLLHKYYFVMSEIVAIYMILNAFSIADSHRHVTIVVCGLCPNNKEDYILWRWGGQMCVFLPISLLA